MGSRFSSSCGSSASSAFFPSLSSSFAKELNELKPVKDGAALVEPNPVKEGVGFAEPKLKGAELLGNLKSGMGFLTGSLSLLPASPFVASSSSPAYRRACI